MRLGAIIRHHSLHWRTLCGFGSSWCSCSVLVAPGCCVSEGGRPFALTNKSSCAWTVTGLIKLALPAGKANPAPPVGPALGAKVRTALWSAEGSRPLPRTPRLSGVRVRAAGREHHGLLQRVQRGHPGQSGHHHPRRNHRLRGASLLPAFPCPATGCYSVVWWHGGATCPSPSCSVLPPCGPPVFAKVASQAARC